MRPVYTVMLFNQLPRTRRIYRPRSGACGRTNKNYGVEPDMILWNAAGSRMLQVRPRRIQNIPASPAVYEDARSCPLPRTTGVVSAREVARVHPRPTTTCFEKEVVGIARVAEWDSRGFMLETGEIETVPEWTPYPYPLTRTCSTDIMLSPVPQTLRVQIDVCTRVLNLRAARTKHLLRLQCTLT